MPNFPRPFSWVYDQQSALLFSRLQLANVVLLYLSQSYSCTTPIMATAAFIYFSSSGGAATIRGQPLIKLIMGIPYIAIYCDYNTVAILKDNNNTLFPAVHQCIVAILSNLNGLLPTAARYLSTGIRFAVMQERTRKRLLHRRLECHCQSWCYFNQHLYAVSGEH